ncbi:hypothetical protein M0R45_026780 [Rubus argutus]|uniref:B-like cyclin n=1 Tax=Rubus argutus TaxID=59490 RepID=A0AAW1WYE7_RUBAR
MADFQTSTHRRKWIFTPEQLAEKYKAANQRAIETMDKYGVALAKVNKDGSLSYPEIPKESSRPKALTIEEEQSMRVYYETKLQEVCNSFHFPHKIQATALIYFKRFYLRWSVMQHEPKNILLTCIYLACMVEENYVSAEELGKGISQDPELMLTNDLLVCQSLEFDLIVFAPYRSIEGFIHGREVPSFGLNGDDDQIQMLKNTAKMEVDKIMLTDAPLLFAPGQLALAALRRANQLHRILDFDTYLGSTLSGAHTISELVEFLDAIDSWVRRYKFPSDKEIQHINRKLKSCWGQSSRDKKSKHESKRSSNEEHNVPSHHEM